MQHLPRVIRPKLIFSNLVSHIRERDELFAYLSDQNLKDYYKTKNPAKTGFSNFLYDQIKTNAPQSFLQNFLLVEHPPVYQLPDHS